MLIFILSFVSMIIYPIVFFVSLQVWDLWVQWRAKEARQDILGAHPITDYSVLSIL